MSTATKTSTATDEPVMHVAVHGSGPNVVFVHGGADGGLAAFPAQLPLQARWTVVLPDRPGHGGTPAAGREDFERDARLIANLVEGLDGGAHIVGHSYGGVVALLAAPYAARSVRSLTVIEPAAFAVARGHRAVDAMEATNRELFGNPPDDPRELMQRFFAMAGIQAEVPDPLPPGMLKSAENFRSLRGPWEAEIPVAELTAAPYPKLVVTGGKSAAFEAIGDALAGAVTAERIVVAGPHAVQNVGEPFNVALEEFLLRAERTRD
jgi:pimeloyl-ACP methyl ester carboxylesterase